MTKARARGLIMLAGAGLLAGGCVTFRVENAPAGDAVFAGCAAYKPAYQVTDDFMRTFNSKDATAWGSTFLFPSVRLASNKLTVINSAKDLESSFDRLGAQGWDHSAWSMRKVVQCGPTKAHMLTTFVRYRKDGTVISQFDSLYIVELRDGRWGLSARSSFAP
ncbi:MAG TPA: hypothetical protein VG942_17785 [Hyphomonadaceae bacterium]|nr:hypothetical protein [Hyphomonadaceae bacterium]